MKINVICTVQAHYNNFSDVRNIIQVAMKTRYQVCIQLNERSIYITGISLKRFISFYAY